MFSLFKKFSVKNYLFWNNLIINNRSMKRLLINAYLLVFARPVFKKMNEVIAKIGLKGLGFISAHDEPRMNGELHFLKKVIDKYRIKSIFDVGANQGHYTQLCSKLGFKGRIYCFEPHPINYKTLKENVKGITDDVFNIGFSNSTGSAQIFDHSDSDGSEHASLFKGVIEIIHKGKPVQHEISLSTIDEFLDERDIKNVGLLKIDTEGSEFNILRGAIDSLKAKRIEIIHFEFNEMNTVSKVFVRDFVDCLLDYNLYRLLPSDFLRINYLTPALNEIFAYQNIIAIRKDVDIEKLPI